MIDATDEGDIMYFDALQNYLTGSEWRETIQVFIDAHCPFFSNINEFHPQQNLVWKSFQEVTESILELMLANLGGSFEALEKALDRIQSRPVRGPRDAAIHDVLDQLMAVESFETFASAMHKQCIEHFEDNGQDIHHNLHDEVMRMGFNISEINTAMEKLGKSPTLEDLITYITSHQQTENEESYQTMPKKKLKTQSTSTANATNDDNYEEEVHYQRKRKTRFANSVDRFVCETESTVGLTIDPNELHAKFVIADSILDSYRNGMLSTSLSSQSDDHCTEQILELLKWAADMKTFSSDLHTAFMEDIPSSDLCFNYAGGLIQWYQQLEHTRQMLNDNALVSSHTNHFLSDQELHRMAELDRIAAMGTQNEQRLHYLLSRHETVRLEVSKMYRKLGIMIAAHPTTLNRNRVENVYLLLKQQLSQSSSDSSFDNQNARDLEAEQAVSDLSQEVGGTEAVNLLLDMQVMEDEQAMLKAEINSLLGIVTQAMDGSNKADDKQVKGNGDGDDDNMSFEQHLLAIDAKLSNEDHVDYKLLLQQEEDLTSTAAAAAADEKQQRLLTHKNESKLDAKSLVDEDKKAEYSTPTKPAIMVSVDPMEQEIEKLKSQHRESLNTLKLVLDNEKKRLLNSLEERLLRRKMLLQQAQKAQNLSQVDDEKKMVSMLESELESQREACELQRDCLVSGFKQKCLAELKLARTIDLSELQGTNDGVNSSNSKDKRLKNEAKEESKTDKDFLQVLVQSKSEDIRSEAGQALIRRYEKERNSLLESFENQRTKEKMVLRQRMLNKRKTQGSIDDDKELQSELDNIDAKIDYEVGVSLSKVQQGALMSLAAVNLDFSQPAQSPAKSPANKDNAYLDEEDENGENESTRKQNRQLLSTLNKASLLRKEYELAGEKLRNELLEKKRKSQQRIQLQNRKNNAQDKKTDFEIEEVDVESQEMNQGIVQAMQEADNMILTAYQHHLHDNEMQHSHSTKKKTDFDKDMHERMKLEIMEAFEVAKNKNLDYLSNTQNRTKQQLQNRLSSSQQKNSKVAWSENMESMLEEAMESTLQTLDIAKVDFPPWKNSSSLSPAQTQADGKISQDDLEIEELDFTPIQIKVVSSNSPLKSAFAPTNNSSTNTNSNSLDGEELLRRERERIKASHKAKEAMLLSDLEASMLEKKKQLEARLKKSKQSRNTSNTDAKENSALEPIEEIEQARLEAELSAWDVAFQKMRDLPELQALTPGAALERMERAFKEHTLGITSGANGGASDTPRIATTAKENREMLEEEAKRKTTEFAVEQQKHDLLMKIQQTRQKQALQRKLMQRSAARQHEDHMRRQSMEINALFDYNEEDDDHEHEGSDNAAAHQKAEPIGIGERKPSNWLKEAKAAANQQQAVRGLDKLPVLNNVSPAVNKGGMASRGMNLGPLMRK